MKRVLQVFFAVVVLAAMIFALAGRWDWWPGWAFLVLVVATMGVESLLLYRHDPELFEARSRFGKGTATFDYWFLTAFTLAFLGILVVGPLDAGRFLWAPLAPGSFAVGAVFYLSGEMLVGWSMYENVFFEKTVRLQPERGQRTITTGPYAYIRHPGYVGFFIGYALGFPLMMTSAWAFVPAAIAVLALVIRTAFEDRFLTEQLEGYAAYRQKVRYRLIPGIW